MDRPPLEGRVQTGSDASRLRIRFLLDGAPLEAYEGETVAAALVAAGRRGLRHTSRHGQPRGVFCGMGVCFECLVQIDGRPGVKACTTPVAEGMRVETQRGAGTWDELG